MNEYNITKYLKKLLKNKMTELFPQHSFKYIYRYKINL